MTYAVVLLIVLIALARGGYAAWGILALELGAVVLFGWAAIEVLFGTSEAERRHYRRQVRGSTSMGTEVEIVMPGESHEILRSKPRERYFLLFGFPFKKTHLGIPFALIVAWVALSLVPLDAHWLSLWSPVALEMRGAGAGAAPAPVSLAPFLTFRGLWMLLACFALVFVGAHLASRPERVERLSLLLFFAGIAFGLYGMAQWLFGLQQLFGRDPTTAALRASASFGNRNHYAAFMEMLLLCGLGWMGTKRAGTLETAPRRRLGFSRRMRDTSGQLFFLGLGVVITALGLIFSLSRSGIAFALAGTAVFVLLRPSTRDPDLTFEVETRERRSGKGHGVLAVALVIVGVAAWIGLDPVVHRFKLLPEEWEAERGRSLVWADSLEAIPDFALTGAGLSSYRYVFPLYRSFGGSVAYSWAHNDYLQWLIELGLPGLFLLLWVMAAVFFRSWRARRAIRGSPVLLHLHAGYLAAVAALALHSFTDFGLHLAANAALLSVILGVSLGVEPLRQD